MQNNCDLKILATLGPASLHEDIVKGMDKWGTDIFRINLSHTEIEDLENTIAKIHLWTKKTICLDTEGAQIRTGRFSNGGTVLDSNRLVEIVCSDRMGDSGILPIRPLDPHLILKTGDILRIDFHSAIVQVLEVSPDVVTGRVLEGGLVGSNKAIAIDRRPPLPPFSEKDLDAFGIAEIFGINHFALSFAYRSEDIDWLRKRFTYPIFVISKIESYNALANLAKLAEDSDALLIDRGDLSREIPLQKIGVMQAYIINVAKEFQKPVYVATNLLDSMHDRKQPSRSEINDITGSILTGAHGLVLAAETAIGNNPVEVVRMAFSLIEETKRFVNHDLNINVVDYVNNIHETHLISPHGGHLVQSYWDGDMSELQAKQRPELQIDEQTLLDLEQIASGTYSPLNGFMDLDEMKSVLEENRLCGGDVWTMPILLQANRQVLELGRSDVVILVSRRTREAVGIIKLKKIEKILDMNAVALKWFGTTDEHHPGVANFLSKGEYLVSGEVFGLQSRDSKVPYMLTARQIREILRDLNLATVVGFHTRNVVHRAHEFIQVQALRQTKADALLISPVIGPKKSGDFLGSVILESYEKLISAGYYKPFRVLIGAFHTYSRYSGPREAVFTALCRKNFGCSHFIVGRDHTGVGDFYNQGDIHQLFDSIGDIGIEPIFFNAAYYCQRCTVVTDHCEHAELDRRSISASEIRRCLKEHKSAPESLLRPEVMGLLQQKIDTQTKIFEG